MIKRFSQATARLLNGDPYPYMELNQNGSYVLYKDHAAILESIGAGGVSGRITSKSIDEHRAEFEAFQEYDLERCNEGFYISINTLNNW